MSHELHIDNELADRIKQRYRNVHSVVRNCAMDIKATTETRIRLITHFDQELEQCQQTLRKDILAGWWELDGILCDLAYGPHAVKPAAKLIPSDPHEEIAEAIGKREYDRTTLLGLNPHKVGYPRLLLTCGRASCFVEAGSVEERAIAIPIQQWVGSVYNDRLRVDVPPDRSESMVTHYGLPTFDRHVVELEFVDDRVKLGNLVYSAWEVQLTGD